MRTISSLELALWITTQRRAKFGPDAAALAHESLVARVPEIIGHRLATSLRKSYVNRDTGKTWLMYDFAKREAFKMAHSYNYDLREFWYDRLLKELS